jgi:hypothetical protein
VLFQTPPFAVPMYTVLGVPGSIAMASTRPDTACRGVPAVWPLASGPAPAGVQLHTPGTGATVGTLPGGDFEGSPRCAFRIARTWEICVSRTPGGTYPRWPKRRSKKSSSRSVGLSTRRPGGSVATCADTSNDPAARAPGAASAVSR